MKKLLLGAMLAALALALWMRSGRSASGLIDIEVNNAPLAEVLQQLERKSGKPILAANKLDARITLSLRRQPLDTILARVADQANAISILVLPIYTADTALTELKHWFESGSPVSRWIDITNLFSGDRRMVYFRDPREPDPLVTLSVTNLPAPEIGGLLSQAAGAHVLLEDHLNSKTSLAVKDTAIASAAETLAAQLGKKSAELRILQSKPRQLTQISANQKEVRETSGNGERRMIRREPSPQDRDRMQKLASMTPAERKAFIQEDLNNKAAQRMMDRLRNQTPEQRVDEMRNRGRPQEEDIRE